MIETARLILRPWREEDRDDLARMCGDPDVMVDYPEPQTREESDVRFRRYSDCFEKQGYCRWALERRADGAFVGYTGIQPVDFPDHPLAGSVEVGWRLVRAAWGQGYASEAARAPLRDGFLRCGMAEIRSYTTTINARSQAVMKRISLMREAERDFVHTNGDTYVVFRAGDGWLARALVECP
jgi:RimJ/RimL family protein N-acetyltransferase